MAEFDYIIIGAGSAGCVLADRLSESGKNTVLILESGGSDARFWIKVPLGYAFTHNDPKLTVDCRTEADAGLNGRSISWPRGRVVGGCSSVNAMAYMRGLDIDFDDWEAAGATGWGWSNVRKTYEDLESGPVKVSDVSKRMHPFSGQFLKAADDAGWPTIDNLNSGAEGLGRYRSTIWNGRRWSAADAFLRPALKRANVKLETRAHVQRIDIVDGAATGVTYERNGELRSLRARREVILSAGAVHSPQILQLSGIGPAALLQKHGITVQNALPEVGRGLQDHLAVTYSFATQRRTLNSILGRTLGRLKSGVHYITTRGGVLSVPVNQVGGYMSANGAGLDTQIYCNPIVYTSTPKGLNVQPDPGYIICAQPCRPESRGEVQIRSGAARDEPAITPNSLSDPRDHAAVIRAGRLLQNLARTPTLQSMRTGAIGPDLMDMDDEGLLEDFRSRASTVYHPSCTCRMGTDRTNSVLDARLRVHGTRGLRVIDASAFPNITSGNTNAPTMMLAARAATLILEDNT